MTKDNLINFLLLISSIFFAFVLLEIFARIYGIIPDADRMTTYTFDNKIGWRAKKNFKFFRSSTVYAHWSYYNPEGFPTSKENFKNYTNTLKPSIALIGDSFVEGYYLPYEQTFANLLDNNCEEKQVINLGISGFSPDQYLMYSRLHLKKYNVKDIIVVFFPGNDINGTHQFEYQGFAKPYFEIGAVNPSNLPLVKKGGLEKKNEEIFKTLIRQSAVYTSLRPFIKNFKKPPFKAKVYDKEKMLKPLKLIGTIAAENPKSNFFVYYIPRYENYINPEIYKTNINTYKQICNELDIRCEDVTEIFAEHNDAGIFYIPNDGHFSSMGSSLIADHLYQLLYTKNRN